MKCNQQETAFTNIALTGTALSSTPKKRNRSPKVPAVQPKTAELAKPNHGDKTVKPMAQFLRLDKKMSHTPANWKKIMTEYDGAVTEVRRLEAIIQQLMDQNTELTGERDDLKAQLETIVRPTLEQAIASFLPRTIKKLKTMVGYNRAIYSNDLRTCLTMVEILLDWQEEQRQLCSKSHKAYLPTFRVWEAFVREVIWTVAIDPEEHTFPCLHPLILKPYKEVQR